MTHGLGGKGSKKSLQVGGRHTSIALPLKYEARCARFTAVDYEREFFNEYDPDHISKCRLCKILNVRSLEEEPIPRDTIQ